MGAIEESFSNWHEALGTTRIPKLEFHSLIFSYLDAFGCKGGLYGWIWLTIVEYIFLLPQKYRSFTHILLPQDYDFITIH